MIPDNEIPDPWEQLDDRDEPTYEVVLPEYPTGWNTNNVYRLTIDDRRDKGEYHENWTVTLYDPYRNMTCEQIPSLMSDKAAMYAALGLMYDMTKYTVEAEDE